MKTSKVKIQSSCLKICINKKKLSYKLDEFIDHEFLKEFTINEILETLKLMDCFFEVIESPSQETIVNVSIKLKPCKSYNKYGIGCKDENCTMLHLCERKFYNNMLHCICPLNHSLKSSHNKNLLQNCCIKADFMIILDFYQVFCYYKF
jgi:hypothetical protein